MKNLLNQLQKIKRLGVIGIKQSLEDEGSSFEDLKIIKVLTKKKALKLNVKIGGCEAKNDIFFCTNLNVSSIVAPMVESEYALSKFLSTVPKSFKGDLFINLETKTSFKNISSIIKSKHFNKLKGVVIGRSDLAHSFGLSKSHVDTKIILKKVEKVLKQIKRKNKITKMGGSITPKSAEFIRHLNKKKLLNFIETRNAELKVSNSMVDSMHNLIPEIYKFEILWLKQRNLNKNISNSKKKDNFKRIQEINLRLTHFNLN